MSRIYFHFDDGEDFEVYGAERAHMGMMINELAFPCYEISDFRTQDDPLLDCMGDLQRDGSSRDVVERAKLWLLAPSISNSFALPGNPDSWQTALNTIMLIGQPMLRLFVRLHAQCEIHCWATYDGGINEGFRAIRGAIVAGLKCGLYRKDMGWEKLAERLDVVRPSTFVCSYSVCQQFPNSECLDSYNTSEADYEKWDARPFPERWHESFAHLNKEHGGMLQIKSLKDPYWFGDGMTAFDVRILANEHKAVTTKNLTQTAAPR